MKVLPAAVAAAGTSVTWAALRQRGSPATWSRQNYRGRPVSLLLGPAAALGAAVGAVTAGCPGAGAVTLSAAAIGLYDDLAGDTHARGLAGHARAVRAGRVTTGVVKAAGLATLGVGAAAGRRRGVGDAMLASVLVAGGANLVNLFDLRPGRAGKVVVAAAGALWAVSGEDRPAATAALAAGGAALSALPSDLAEAGMLGDCGASALGALLGWAVLRHSSPRLRLAAAATIVGLTAASEGVSFSAVIDRRPLLRRLDRLGRRAS